jgi:Ca2+-binding EF-hand superfamily protein
MIVENEEGGMIPFERARALAERKMTQRDPLDMIRAAFKLFDEEGRGRIGLRELKKVSRELGEVYIEEELFEMVAQVGSGNDGEVSQEDFTRLMRKTKLFGSLS